MKKLHSAILFIFLIILIFFTYFSINKFMTNDYGAYSVLEVIKKQEELIGKQIKIIGVPGCTQFQTDYFEYFNLYLSNNANQFKGIYINFDIAVGERRNLFNDKFKYFYNSYLVMLEGEENCYNTFEKIADAKDKNRLVIEGVLTKTFDDKNLELRLI